MRGAILLTLVLTLSIFSLWSPVLSAEKNSAYYWDYFLAYNFTFNYNIKYLALSSNGTLMAVFLNNNSLIVFRNETPIGRFNVFGEIGAAGFSPSGRILYFEQEAPRRFYLVFLETGEVREFEIKSKIRVVAFSHDEKYIALGGVRDNTKSPENFIYFMDLESCEILWKHRVVKDVHKLFFTEDGKLISLTSETFCYACLLAKEKHVKYFNLNGKVLLKTERRHVEDIFPTSKLGELGIVYVDKIVKYRVDFTKRILENVKEISIEGLGVYRGLSPDGRYLYYEQQDNKQTVISVVNPERGIIYVKKVKLTKYSNDRREAFLANNFTVLLYYYRGGESLAKVIVFRQEGRRHEIIVRSDYGKMVFSDDADRIIIYSSKSILVYQYMKKKVEMPEEKEKYYQLNVVILDNFNNTLDNVNLTIKELGLSVILSNGTWSQLVPEGVYTILVSKEDFIDAIKVVNLTADTILQVKLKPRIFKLKIEVKDLSGAEVVNASVVLYRSGGELLSKNKTNVEGECSFEVKEGSYEILVLKEDTIARETVEVRGDTSVTVVLPFEAVKKARLTLVATDDTGFKIENYTAYFLDEKGYLVTVYSPLMNETESVELPPGKYTIRVKAEGYRSRTIEVEAEGEKSYTITLEKEEEVEKKREADYTFYVVAAVAAAIAVVAGVLLKMKRFVRKKR